LKEHSLISAGDLGVVISELGEPDPLPESLPGETVTQA